MDDGWPRSRTYVILSSANWLGFLATVAFLTWGTDDARLPVFVLWSIVLVAAATVGAQFFAAYRLVAAQDEYIRGITAKRGIAAGGVTITAAVLWGLAQQFLAVPEVPMWTVYPLFWGAFGIVTPFIRSSHA
ncbi:MAG TPA: hypothetical protein VGB08_05790 [Allosphingosinicella sp.]|jgi:hypothetical protein